MSGQANKSDKPGEYENFTSALKKILSVPRSEIKATLDAEKRARKQHAKPSSVRASREKG